MQQNTKLPIQPLFEDKHGVVRFIENRIVSKLLETSHLDLNTLAVMDFTQQEREQFAQLIGYSLNGFGELNYASNEVYAAAERIAETGKTEDEVRALVLREALQNVKKSVNEAVKTLFNLDLDD